MNITFAAIERETESEIFRLEIKLQSKIFSRSALKVQKIASKRILIVKQTPFTYFTRISMEYFLLWEAFGPHPVMNGKTTQPHSMWQMPE